MTQYSLPTSNSEDPRGLKDYIRETARKYGVDPDVALKVAKSEGLRDFSGDGGKSGGAFQLYTGGGLGNEFQKQTGLDPLDPKNEKATIDYALKHASQSGWKPWHGAAKVGVGEFDGISGGQAAGSGSASSDTAASASAGDSVAGTHTSTATPDTGVDTSPTATGASTSDFISKLQDPKTGTSAALGEGINSLGQAVAGTGMNKDITAMPSSPIPVAMPSTPRMVPTVNPQTVEQQRQQLASVMQRLNAGAQAQPPRFEVQPVPRSNFVSQPVPQLRRQY